MTLNMEALTFNKNGLIPAVVQDVRGQVLMLAYMNEASLRRTLDTGETWFYSRSRQQLWHKGETSGHTQRVLAIAADCDGDALLVTVEQTGVACHTGAATCFHRPLQGGHAQAVADPQGTGQAQAPGQAAADWAAELAGLEAVIRARQGADPAESYTASLLADLDRACKKVGEEATEVVLAVKNGDRPNLVHEAADLLYHTLVLLVSHGLGLEQVADELRRRRQE